MSGVGHHRHGFQIASFRFLAGLLLLAWGATLAVHGLGLNPTPVGQVVDTYWPVPFILWGLAGCVESLVTRSSGIFLYVLVALAAAALQLNNLALGHVQIATIVWALVIIFCAVAVLRGDAWHGWFHVRRFGVGDLDISAPGVGSRWPRQHESLIGDIRLDLSQMHIPDGETPIELSGLVGDITVLVPQDLPIEVEAESRVGEIRIFEQRAEGLGRHLSYVSPGYEGAARKVRITAHLLVGDITVQPF